MKSSFIFSFLILLTQVTLHQADAAEELIYTVRPGDNLWDLAGTHCIAIGYYRKLQQHNAVQHPLRLIPGTRLNIPVAWLKHAPAQADVVSVRGHIQLISGTDSSTRVPKAGDELNAGDKIKTGHDGSMRVRFADGSQLIVKPGTELTMDALSAYGDGSMIDTRLRMQHGRMDTEVRSNRDASSHYEIVTPAAVSIVRGTDFRISAENNRPVSRTEVLQGTVGVSGASTTRAVPAGFGTVAEAGKPPIEPRPLLSPPEIEHWPKQLRLWPETLTWPAVDSAVAYRVQVGKASDKSLLLIDSKLTVNRYELPLLADGRYLVQLRAIDDLGLEGLNAEHRLNIAARPFAPVLLKPAAGDRVRQSEVAFHWQAVEGTGHYLIQIGRDPQISEIVLEQKLAATEFVPETRLPAGSYYWRVASYRDSGTVGPLSPARRLHIIPPPAAPEMSLAERGEEGIRFQWKGVTAASSYRFQLSSGPDFSTINKELVTVEAEIVIPRLHAGTYYYRVSAIDADGYSGPYSDTRRYVHASGFYWPLLFILFLPMVL